MKSSGDSGWDTFSTSWSADVSSAYGAGKPATSECQGPSCMNSKTHIQSRSQTGAPSLSVALVVALLVMSFSIAHAAPPLVTNVRAAQRPGTQLVDVYYDLADPDSATLTVSVTV
ncbi:MAG: hypothetical protein IH623_01700 [Verrucomicrobia bacterium]|nr:hypothetical protein [Verrucomicrobiota bacterium]